MSNTVNKSAYIFENSFENKKNSVSKAHLQIRLGFIRKVYGLLLAQIVITLTVCVCFYLNSGSMYYVLMNKWHRDVAMISSLVLLGLLYMNKHNSPLNLILLFSFTIVQAYILGTLLIFYKSALVLRALTVATGAFIGLHMYALQSDKDFTKMKQILYMGVWSLTLGGILQLFYPISGLELGLSYLGVIIFSLYIIYDVQMIMNKVSPEDYVFATISLYLDMINLFLNILKLLQQLEKKKKRDD